MRLQAVWPEVEMRIVLQVSGEGPVEFPEEHHSANCHEGTFYQQVVDSMLLIGESRAKQSKL